MTEFENLVLEQFQKINERFDKMEERLDSLEKGQSEMQKDITKIKLRIENDISPTQKMLCEMQLENSKRLILLEKSVEEITDSLVIDEVIKGISQN